MRARSTSSRVAPVAEVARLEAPLRGHRGQPRSSGHLTTLRMKTASSIGSVSLPVKVFCWLGWKEPSNIPAGDLGLATDARNWFRAGSSFPAPWPTARRTPSHAKAPERDHDAQVRHERHLPHEVGEARVPLVDRRLVGRRGAPDGGA